MNFHLFVIQMPSNSSSFTSHKSWDYSIHYNFVLKKMFLKEGTMLYLIFFEGKTLGEKMWHLLEKRDKLDLT